ncbi:GAF domain-containing protein [Nostoc sp.]|uniref:GAF domain-containing protein n=1 Tax=Nostoc sp. TaxID=1180 RepID=UPI002FFCA9D6
MVINNFVRLNVRKRAKYLCEYCHSPERSNATPFTIDHIIPQSLGGRVRAIADIQLEPIQPCHRDFLRNMQVRANLVVPILIKRGLWGLLVAHHCQSPHHWSPLDIEMMQTGAQTLATAPYILET